MAQGSPIVIVGGRLFSDERRTLGDLNFWPEYTGSQKLTSRLREKAARAKRRLLS